MCQCAICSFSLTPFTMPESHLIFLPCPGSSRSPLVLVSCVFMVLVPASCIECMSLLELCFPCESVRGQWNESFAFSVEYRIVNENLLYVVFVFLRGQDVWFVQFLSTAPFWSLNAMFQYCLYMVSHSSSQDTQDAAASRKGFSGVMKGTFAWDNSCSVTWQGCSLHG